MNRKILLDAPATAPALQFDTYASALKTIIEDSDPRFAIGVFGGWGSGKSTLMQLIESRLDPERVVVVRFSAWRYEKEEHLIVPLLDTIRDALVAWRTPSAKAKHLAMETASTVGKVMYSILSGINMKVGIPGAVELSLDANKALASASRIASEDREAENPKSFYHASFRALSEAFSRFVGTHKGRRFVVFVDDLDRCLPEGALEVLESMKLFFDLDGFVFVVGLDQQVVEAAIDVRYKDVVASANAFQVRGSDYIKKIFQVPFSLFPVRVNDIDEFLESVIREAELAPEQAVELRGVVSPHLSYLPAEAGINPREIKRYINAFTLVMQIKPLLNANALLAVQLFRFRQDWSIVQEGFLAYRDVFLSALYDRVNDNRPASLNALDSRFSSLPLDFLEYIGPGRPGNALLSVPNVDDYVFAGETTSVEPGHGSAEIVRSMATLRTALKRVGVGPPTPDDRQMVLSEIRQLRRMLSPDSPLGTGALSVTSELERLEKEFLEEKAKSLDPRWADWADGVVSTLLRRR